MSHLEITNKVAVQQNSKQSGLLLLSTLLLFQRLNYIILDSGLEVRFLSISRISLQV